MNFANLYKKKYYYNKGEIEKNLKFTSYMKKKNSKGLLGFNATSTNVFMKLNLKGRILACYKEEPKDNTNPLHILFVKNVTSIEEKVNGKEGHFKIIEKDKFWQFKCEDQVLKKNWIKIIKFFSELYKDDEDLIERSLDDPIDLNTLIKIKAENENKFFDTNYKKLYDYSSFIKDKGIKKLFENVPLENLKNRLLISPVEKETVKRTDGDKSEPQTPITPITPITGRDTNLKRFQIDSLVSHRYYMVMLCSLTSTEIDEDYFREDTTVIEKESLPGWMNFGVFYFFDYKNPGDDSFFKKANAAKDIEFVILEKDGKTLNIQLPEKHFFLAFRSSWESLMWWQGFQRIINYERMLLRTKKKELLFDIEKIYHLHAKNHTLEIKNLMKELGKNLTIDVPCSVFCQALNKLTQKINSFLDAFHARKPFDIFLYKFCVFIFNRKIREMINQIWNKYNQTLSSIDISDLLSAIFKYDSMLDQWKIKDVNMNNWLSAILKTFCSRHFVKSKEIIANILRNIKMPPELVKDKLVEKTSGPLSFFINSLFNFYDKFKCEKSAKKIMKECGINLIIFFTTVLKILNSDQFPIENYLALLNNKYIKCLNNFKRKIMKDTEKKFSMVIIKQIINENYLLKLIFKIEKKCLKEIDNHFQSEIAKKFLGKNNFVDFNLDEIMENIVSEFKKSTKLLNNQCFVEQFFCGFFKQLLYSYFEQFIQLSVKINQNNFRTIKSKVETDVKIVENLTSQYAPEMKKTSKFYMQQLLNFLNSNSIEECIISILNIQVFYKELITIENVRNLLTVKYHFPEVSLNYINNFFRDSLEVSERKERLINKISSIFIVFCVVVKFVKKIKLLLMVKKNKSKMNENDMILKYKEPELEVLHPTYEQIYMTRCWGKMLLFDKKHNHKKISKYLKEKIQTNTGWDDYYFFFNVGAFSITKDTLPKQILFNILYKNFKEIKMLGSYCLYIKEKTTGYAFYFKQKEKATKFFEYFTILLATSSTDTPQNEIEPLILNNCMTHLKWYEEPINHYFDFNHYDVNNNADEGNDRIEFDENLLEDFSDVEENSN